MGIIKLLDKSVANLIAAGEVVERPASVVKELLENAVDAGATHITTEIKNGGIKYIRVMDNGCGMGADDVRNSLVRHATSKIQKADDLNAIMTLGFRGEALASIAAVSKLEIYTKTEESETGFRLLSDPNGEIGVSEAGCPKGTTVLVRELFCTAPARMKFLKKDYTEAGYIQDIVNRLALGMPNISFKFINNDKELLFTSGDGNLKNAVRAVLGRDIAAAMIESDYEENGIRAYGLCGKAEAARANRSMQSFFINGRYIKSALLTRAVEEAYKNELMTGKFPACVINIEIKPQMVDINVHPTKLEAKFANESEVYHAVYWAVKNALYSKKTVPKVKNPPKIKLNAENPQGVQVKLSQNEIQPKPERAVLPENVSMKEYGFLKKDEKHEEFNAGNISDPVFAEFTEKQKITAHKEEKPKIAETERIILSPVQSEKEKASEKFEPKAEIGKITENEEKTENEEILPYKICGQIFNTYIIVEREGEMLLVDQHAAHERLRYERLLLQYENRKIASQSLLIPAYVELTAVELSEVREFCDELLSLGFEVDEFGDKTVKIRAVPMEAADGNATDLFLEVLKNLSQNRKSDMTEKMRSAIYQISCKGAVKANMQLKESEMKALLDNVFALKGINTCPHGRPITISFTKYFIEKQFKRIV